MSKRVLIVIGLIGLILIMGCSKKDVFYTMKSEMNGNLPIKIIYIDEKTEAALGKFPINRKYYVDLLNELQKDKPKAVVLKFFFTDESPEDTLLADTVKTMGNVFSQAAASSDSKDASGNIELLPSLGENTIGIPNYTKVLAPNALLSKAFASIGFANSINKGTEFEQYQLLVGVNDKVYPSLPLVLMQYLYPGELKIEKNQVSNSHFQVKMNDQGSLKIDLSKPGALYKSYSFTDVIQKKYSGEFKDSIVFVFVSNYLSPLVSSQYAAEHSPVEINADALNTLLKSVQTN